MKKIVITGGSGFVGSQLIYYLQNKYEIISVDNLSYGTEDNLYLTPKVKNYNIDIGSKEFADLIENYKPDIVIHLAGIAPLPDCQSDPVKAYTTNVVGTVNVIESCRIANVSKVIFSSTSAIYENCTQLPFREENIDKIPDLHYATTKYQCEHIIRNYIKLYNMDISIVRFFNVYGINQDHRRKHPPFMGYIVKCILNNETPIFYGDGTQERDYIFSEDVADIINVILDSSGTAGQVYNACSGIGYSVNDIYKVFQKVFNFKKEPIFTNPKEFWDKYPELFSGGYPLNKDRIIKEVEKKSIGCSSSTQEKLNGWKPKYSLEEGVRKIYESLCNNTDKM